MRRRAAAAALLAAALVVLAGCGGSSSPSPLQPRPTGPPDLAAFLRLPVATPASCPPNVNGTTSGRRSPWVGHVDISVFLRSGTDARTIRSLRTRLARLPHVNQIYFESQAQAVAEFARLYTCSERVDPAAAPASYRIALFALTQRARDNLVREIQVMPGVATVSCDPSNPCVDVKPSPK